MNDETTHGPARSASQTGPLFQRHDTLASVRHVEARLTSLYEDMRIISQDVEMDMLLRDEVYRLRYHIRRVALVARSVATMAQARREREEYERIWPPPEEEEDDPYRTVADVPTVPDVGAGVAED